MYKQQNYKIYEAKTNRTRKFSVKFTDKEGYGE